MRLALPWPPTINHYYAPGPRLGTYYMTAAARAYRIEVSTRVGAQRMRQHLTGRLSLCVEAYPPDRRARDLDNLLKAVQDSLQHAGVYVSDSQIDSLQVVRCGIVKGGKIVVAVEEIDATDTGWRTALGDA